MKKTIGQLSKRIAERNKLIGSMPEIWAIRSGAKANYGLYVGEWSPMSACWEDAKLFDCQGRAQDYVCSGVVDSIGSPYAVQVK